VCSLRLIGRSGARRGDEILRSKGWRLFQCWCVWSDEEGEELADVVVVGLDAEQVATQRQQDCCKARGQMARQWRQDCVGVA
jgi:hypothetical protein